MARGFDRSSDEYLMHNAGVVSGVPFTMAGWMFPIEHSETLYTMMGLGYTGNYSDFFRFTWRPSSPNVRAITSSTSGASGAVTSAGPNLDQWNHVAATFITTSSTAVFLNGGNKGTDSRYCLPSNSPNRTAIGANVRQSGYDWFEFDGYLAEFAIWNIVLTDPEIAVLAAGYSPLFVRPQNIVGYWPLIRKGSAIDNPDIVGHYNMTDYNGPSDASHCRIIYPGEVFVGEGKPEVRVAVLMQHYRKMRVA
jgi:hypothetical protein